MTGFETRFTAAICLMVFAISTMCGAQIGNAQEASKNPQVREAKRQLEAAIEAAVAEYVAKLDSAAKEVAAQGEFDEAKKISDEKKVMEKYGLSTMPDPTSKAKRTLLAHIFRKTDGAILDFRSDYTAYGRHNGLTTNWVMTDAQTLITGATNPNKPVYIYKFDKSLSRGTVYKYQPVNERRHTIRRQ